MGLLTHYFLHPHRIFSARPSCIIRPGPRPTSKHPFFCSPSSWTNTSSRIPSVGFGKACRFDILPSLFYHSTRLVLTFQLSINQPNSPGALPSFTEPKDNDTKLRDPSTFPILNFHSKLFKHSATSKLPADKARRHCKYTEFCSITASKGRHGTWATWLASLPLFDKAARHCATHNVIVREHRHTELVTVVTSHFESGLLRNKCAVIENMLDR